MSQVRKPSRWNLLLGTLLLALWALSAAWLGADVEVLLPVATVLCGVGAVLTMLRERSLGRISSPLMWAGCSAGALFMLWGALHLTALPAGARTLGSGLLILLLLGVITSMRRLGSSSGGATRNEVRS